MSARNFLLLGAALAFFAASSPVPAQVVPPAPPGITNFTLNGSQRVLRWTPYPAAQSFKVFSTTDLRTPFTEDTSGAVSGYSWTGTNTGSARFFRLDTTPLDSNALLTATVLNRLAYGPTPTLLDRFKTNSIENYIAKQLAPETVTETVQNQHTNIAFFEGKFAPPGTPVLLTNGTGPGSAAIGDLRAWFSMRAVGADRQLLEVLTQFLENHFVTQFTKSLDYFQNHYGDFNTRGRVATELEYREITRWRNALMNPGATFKDLLTISCESPAMIVFLDTVSSRGDGSRVPNENFSREIMELFSMGVDNGYDQTDIVDMSHAWAGWTVDFVAPTNVFNPFATRLLATVGNTVSNVPGVWGFVFRTNYHGTSRSIFTNKFVPARFGAPWTTRTYANATPGSYQLTFPARTGTNAIQDGYDIIAHLADLPFTQEYMSVKLCRLFVHEDFAHGYDFTAPQLSLEAELVRQCMMAWETNMPRGQIRKVLDVIFKSDLFRSHTAAFAKVKTPFEFTVSAIRALRVSTNGTGAHGSWSADTDGSALATPMNRMGAMVLFDRGEPDGYPESGAGWISAGTLAERVRWTQSLLIASGQTGHSGSQGGSGNDAGNSVTSPVRLLFTRLPVLADQQDAAKVADVFLGLLFPGEGAANLSLYRTAAINFLNTADDGVTASSFAALTPGTTTGNNTYDTRVRGMVAMLMTMQRFQEQ
ncbi:MAG: hypothetical protein B9S33_02420 [Pedosphaera sp. Tous-C6FEB]|nr:MAG: hypothetical protein B9S33_02420 [Pedosphaera sp. Tous-C6FEB]